ncbi:MAG: hypothetical protein K0Q47_92 [Sedimentibacter sp.]|jgi:hypothetical protein|nr:hypothetical protein [Sedimentibacter sp.]
MYNFVRVKDILGKCREYEKTLNEFENVIRIQLKMAGSSEKRDWKEAAVKSESSVVKCLFEEYKSVKRFYQLFLESEYTDKDQLLPCYPEDGNENANSEQSTLNGTLETGE